MMLIAESCGEDKGRNSVSPEEKKTVSLVNKDATRL